jgi:hypothetical protein
MMSFRHRNRSVRSQSNQKAMAASSSMRSFASGDHIVVLKMLLHIRSQHLRCVMARGYNFDDAEIKGMEPLVFLGAAFDCNFE